MQLGKGSQPAPPSRPRLELTVRALASAGACYRPSRFRDECLSREMLLNLREARVVIADWRQHYNRERPHSRLGYLSPEDFIQTKILTP